MQPESPDVRNSILSVIKSVTGMNSREAKMKTQYENNSDIENLNKKNLNKENLNKENLNKSEDKLLEEKQERIRLLVESLNEAARAYYAQDKEIMSNYEYDKLYDELVALEEETGIILSNSPTVNVGYEAVEELPKEAHEAPMLSLGKTKDREELVTWLQGRDGLLSWKLDGLTVVLTYREGKLTKAVTRGNGEVGEVVTNNAKTFKNLPLQIAFKGELVLRGEAVITYSDFEKINAQIEDVDAKYKNPRNLCSGSVRQLNNEVTAQRNVKLYAFSLVKAEGIDFENSREKQFQFLKDQGFAVVDYEKVNPETIIEAVEAFENRIKTYDVPSDGLVLSFEDIAYGEALGRTAKFPRHSIAFKWQDEIRETVLKEMEWSASRTGLINPVAIFEPVELEGTTVSRASVHNISIVRGLKLGIGDRITVYKANMIIPQIAENLTCSDTLEIPTVCPVCGGSTRIHSVNEVQSLYCTNEDCDAKKIKAFTLFVSRDALNIEGLSEMTLEKLLGQGFLHEFADIYHLQDYKEQIVEMEGFGEKSYQNLIESIETSRETTLPRVLYASGIAGIGVATAKVLSRHFDYDVDRLIQADTAQLGEVEGIGEIIAAGFVEYMQKQKNVEQLRRLLQELKLEQVAAAETDTPLSGKSFCITGSLNYYASRNELKDIICAITKRLQK